MAASEQDIKRAKELADIEEQRLKTKQKLNSLDADAIGLSSSLVDNVKELQGISVKRSTFDQSLLKINKQISFEILGQKGGLTGISSIQKQITKNQDLIAKSKRIENSLTDSLGGKQKDSLKKAKEQVDLISKYNAYQKQQALNANITGKYNEEGVKQIEILKEKAFEKLAIEEEILGVIGKQSIFTYSQTKILEDQNKEREKDLENAKKLKKEEQEKAEQVNKNLGITGALLKGAEGFMSKIGLGDLSSAMGFNQINKELEEYSASLEKGGENFVDGTTDAQKQQKTMGKSFELMGNAAKKALTDPMVRVAIAMKAISAVVGAIAEGFKRFDKTTGSISKSLNITNSEAGGIAQSMVRASFGSDKLFVSSKGLSESLIAVNDSLGTSVVLSNDQLETFTKLRETAGLTNEELMGVQKLSLANGASFDDNADSLINQVNALNKSNGLYVNAKDVLKDVSKLSAATTLSLGKSPEALAEAVTVAKQLGMEMSKIDAIAGSLLDFESSIENELQAELLLNKDINLEKARQAALNNDFATVAKEIAEQAGNSAEFTAMNRIQQEALAKAVGMNREDLAETLFLQEAIAGASGDEAVRRERLLNARIKEVGLAQAQKEAQEGGLEAMLDQATASEKMEASMGKLNELSNALGAMLAPVVNMFAAIAGAIMESKVAMAVLAGVIGAVTVALGFLAAKAIITAVANIWGGMMAFLGPVGIPLAIAATAGMIGGIAAAVTSVGDVNSAADGKTQISTKEGGLFELSPNDDLVAAPGASKALEMAAKGGGNTTTIVQQAPTPTAKTPENNEQADKTNSLLEEILNFQVKQPQLSSVGLYEVQ